MDVKVKGFVYNAWQYTIVLVLCYPLCVGGMLYIIIKNVIYSMENP